VRERLNREAGERMEARERELTDDDAAGMDRDASGMGGNADADADGGGGGDVQSVILPSDPSAVDSMKGLSEGDKRDLKQSIAAANGLKERADRVQREVQHVREQADEAEHTGVVPADAVAITRFRSLRGTQ